VNIMTSPLQIYTMPKCLIVRFPQTLACLSWAPWNGGETSASAVANCQVDLHGGGTTDTLAEDFRGWLSAVCLVPEDTIGLMTAAKVGAYQDCFVSSSGGAWVHVVGTVGLSNARSVLDDADVVSGHRCEPAGTVNVIITTNALPAVSGRTQAIHIAASAKAAAFRDTGIISRKSDRPADLTGTDCLVVAASGEVEEDHCGLHTVLGEMIGRAVYTVVSKGIAVASHVDPGLMLGCSWERPYELPNLDSTDS
jgi:adenosylcobinamide amidohydrolase